MPSLPSPPAYRNSRDMDEPTSARVVNVSFVCSLGMLRALRERAAQEERSVSSVVRHAISIYLRYPSGGPAPLDPPQAG